MHLKISEKGLDLIRNFESLYLKAYLCPAGIWTIGYGHTKNVKEGDIVDKSQANNFLIDDTYIAEFYVRKYVDVPLKQHAFDALVSWTFNLGAGNLKNSTMLKVINSGQFDEVAEQIKRWDKGRVGGELKQLSGLVKRRKAEAILFCGGDWKIAIYD